VRTKDERLADVRRVVAAARAVQIERARWTAEIARDTGLSPEGVELGLTRHLETAPPEEELASLVARAGDTEEVHVILSANVFVAPLRAVAIARAAAPRVVVRPSRRDPTFARALIEAARDPALVLATEIALGELARGEVHVYGRDETIADVRATVPAHVIVRGHGAGMGVAWITERAALAAAAAALADDVVAFDQRGCLSPRVAFVEGDDARAEAFASALHDVLGALEQRVPRGALSEEERAASARYVDTVSFLGAALRTEQHVVGVAPSDPFTPPFIPPTGRHLHVTSASSADALAAAIAPLARFVVTVGSDDPARAARIAPPHARLAALGAMQRPPLDGPVDLRGDRR